MQRCPVCPLNPGRHSLPRCQHPLPDGAFVTAAGPLLAHRYQHRPQSTRGVILGVLYSAHLDNCVPMTRISYYSTVQSILAFLKALCVLPLHPFPPPPPAPGKPWQPLMFLLSFSFCLFCSVTQRQESYSRQPSRTGFFHLTTCI